MTEDTGFPAVTEPDAPEPDAAPETVPDPEPGDEPQPDAEPAETPSVPPEATPFIPTDGVAGWLRDALLTIHRRLTNLGG